MKCRSYGEVYVWKARYSNFNSFLEITDHDEADSGVNIHNSTIQLFARSNKFSIETLIEECISVVTKMYEYQNQKMLKYITLLQLRPITAPM